MPAKPPPSATILRYPYLGLREALKGETEGRKDRPCCLALQVFLERDQRRHLILLAISSKPQAADQDAIEIPDIERRRGGLGCYSSAWLVVSEYNYDIAEDSFYLDPNADSLGAFSATFMAHIARALRPAFNRRASRVSRTE